MPKKPNPEVVSAAIYDVVDNQLRDGEPPETRQTLERLLAEGHSLSEARRLIAAVVASEIFTRATCAGNALAHPVTRLRRNASKRHGFLAGIRSFDGGFGEGDK